MRLLRVSVVCVAMGCGLAAAQMPAAPSPAASVAWPGAETPLGAQIVAMVNEPAVSRAHWGIAVTALDGTPIFGLNQGQVFRPASNAKLYTTSVALALLGRNQRFETRVVTAGNLDANGVLHGDIRIEGRGDANFGEEDIPYVRPADRPKNPPVLLTIPDIEDLAKKIVAKGVKEVQGDLISSDEYFAATPYLNDWAWDDLIWAYGAPVSALTIHDNEVDVTVTPGKEGERAAVSVIPDVPYYTIDNQVQTSSGTGSCDARLDFSLEAGTKTLKIRGGISPDHAPCKEQIAIDDPTEYAAIALKAALERRGVHVTGAIRTRHWEADEQPGTPEENTQAEAELQRRFSPAEVDLPACAAGPDPGPNPGPPAPPEILLATHAAPPLRLDMTLTNKVSDNLHAEIFLRNMASALCEPRTLRNSLRIQRQFLITRVGIDPGDFVLYDGSGLSGHDLVAPRATAQLLHYASTQPWFADWKTSLPVAGEDGTLASRFGKPPLKDHLFAKTGTLSQTRALSGYLECASGRTVIFSIMVDTHMPGSADQAVMDRIVAAIAAAN